MWLVHIHIPYILYIPKERKKTQLNLISKHGCRRKTRCLERSGCWVKPPILADLCYWELPVTTQHICATLKIQYLVTQAAFSASFLVQTRYNQKNTCLIMKTRKNQQHGGGVEARHSSELQESRRQQALLLLVATDRWQPVLYIVSGHCLVCDWLRKVFVVAGLLSVFLGRSRNTELMYYISKAACWNITGAKISCALQLF